MVASVRGNGNATYDVYAFMTAKTTECYKK